MTNTIDSVSDELKLETHKLNLQKQKHQYVKFKLLNLHKMNYFISAGIAWSLCCCGKIIAKKNIKCHNKSKFHITHS